MIIQKNLIKRFLFVFDSYLKTIKKDTTQHTLCLVAHPIKRPPLYFPSFPILFDTWNTYICILTGKYTLLVEVFFLLVVLQTSNTSWGKRNKQEMFQISQNR